jgi:tetratricopeptide (TPR) repeat protein
MLTEDTDKSRPRARRRLSAAAPAALLRVCAALALAAGVATAAGPAPEPPGNGAEPAPAVLPLTEAVSAAAGQVTGAAGGRADYVVGTLPNSNLLDGYVLHMTAANLKAAGARVRRLDGALRRPNGEPPPALPQPLLHELRLEGADVFVHAWTTVVGAQRYLGAAAYAVPTGRLTASTSVPCHLSEGLAPLASAERTRMGTADRNWLDLFARLFAPAKAGSGEASLLRAEADYFMDVGLWEQAAGRFLQVAASSPTSHFMRGVVSLQLAGRAERAVSLVEEALRQHPDSGPLWALRGWLSLRQGRPDDAIMWFEQARLSGMAREGLYRYARGLMALEQEDDVAAEQELTRAAELLPDGLFAQLQIARLHRNRAELDEAIKWYRRATQTPDAPAETWAELAVALEANGDVEGAVAALRRAFRASSGNVVITRHLAGLLKRQGQHEEALDVLRRAAEANPRKPNLLAAYGDMAAEMWRIEEAERAFRESLSAAGEFPYGQVRLAAVEALQREYGEARARLTELLARRPGYAPGRIELARTLSQLDRAEEAVAALKEVTTSAEHEVVARLQLVDVCLSQGLEAAAQAVEHAQIAASARPDAETYAALSRAFLAAGDAGNAETAARTALEKDARAATAHLALARVLLAKEDLDGALNAAERALELDPYLLAALELAGSAWARRGEYRKCAECWERALTMNPWDADLHRRLSEVLGPRLGDWTGTDRHHRRYVELERMRTEAAR